MLYCTFVMKCTLNEKVPADLALWEWMSQHLMSNYYYVKLYHWDNCVINRALHVCMFFSLTLFCIFPSKAVLPICLEQPMQREHLRNRLFSNLLVCKNVICRTWNFCVSHATLWPPTNLCPYLPIYPRYTTLFDTHLLIFFVLSFSFLISHH